jgi:hypothetical protein
MTKGKESITTCKMYSMAEQEPQPPQTVSEVAEPDEKKKRGGGRKGVEREYYQVASKANMVGRQSWLPGRCGTPGTAGPAMG